MLLKILAMQETIQQNLQALEIALESDRQEIRRVVMSKPELSLTPAQAIITDNGTDSEISEMLEFLTVVDAQQWQDSNVLAID